MPSLLQWEPGWGVKLGVVFVSAVKYNVIPLNDWERKLSYSP